jgi:hypothetical protein
MILNAATVAFVGLMVLARQSEVQRMRYAKMVIGANSTEDAIQFEILFDAIIVGGVFYVCGLIVLAVIKFLITPTAR